MRSYEETIELLTRLGKLKKRRVIDHFIQNGNLILVYQDFKNDSPKFDLDDLQKQFEERHAMLEELFGPPIK